LAAAGVAAGLAAGGCDKNGGKDAKATPTATAAPAGAVGVVDYDRVFQDLGWRDEVTKSLQGTETTLRMTLDSYGRDIARALDERRVAIARAANLNPRQVDDLHNNRDLDKLPLSPQQKEELFRSLSIAQQYGQNAQANAQRIMNDRQRQVSAKYRDSVKPAVRRVAETNGMSVMITASDAVVFYSSTVDMTNKVVDDLRAARPPHDLPDAPKLDPLLPRVQLNAPPAPPPPTTGPAAATQPR
jgi:Skp family chaperone for outer membrane proteins